MEQWTILGVDTNATIKFNDGRSVDGVRWHMVGEAPDQPKGRYLGKVVKDQFVSHERIKALGVEPMPGDEIIMYFNRYGDIAKVEIIK